jgi:hypothetical protein
MSAYFRIAFILLLVGVFPYLPGCHQFWTISPVDVVVLDGETGQPVPSASVAVKYDGQSSAWFMPPEEQRKTDGQGKAIIPVADFRAGSIFWDVSADGYADERPHADSGGGERVPGAFLPSDKADDSSGLHAVVRLLKGPAPRITVVVPSGYRGPVWVEFVDKQGWAKPGEREFAYPANARGYVEIPTISLFCSVSRENLFAQYADGTPIPAGDFGQDQVGFRWVCGGERVKSGKPPTRSLWMVGTTTNLAELKRRIRRPTFDPSPSNWEIDGNSVEQLFRFAKGIPSK